MLIHCQGIYELPTMNSTLQATKTTVTTQYQGRSIKPAAPISILLIDDNADFRQGLQQLLRFYSSTSTLQFQIVGHAVSVDQGIQLAHEQSPKLILLDLELNQEPGELFLRRWLAQPDRKRSHSRVLVLSGHEEDEWIFKAMKAGAHGYLVKHKIAGQLLDAIATVLRNEIYLSSDVATRFFRLFHFYGGHSLTGETSVHLTQREQEVLVWLTQGASNEKISSELNITVGTVKAYLTAIFGKLEAENRTEAALKALKLGLVAV